MPSLKGLINWQVAQKGRKSGRVLGSPAPLLNSVDGERGLGPDAVVDKVLRKAHSYGNIHGYIGFRSLPPRACMLFHMLLAKQCD